MPTSKPEVPLFHIFSKFSYQPLPVSFINIQVEGRDIDQKENDSGKKCEEMRLDLYMTTYRGNITNVMMIGDINHLIHNM